MPELNDSAFVGVPQDAATGRAAWERTRPEWEALDPRPASLPRYTAEKAASGVLNQWPAVQAESPLFLAYFDSAERDALQAAVDRLPRLAHAVHYAHGQFLLNDPQRRSAEGLQEGSRLRELGLAWADRLEANQLLAQGAARSIRAGGGHMDLARDLQALAEHLAPHLALIEALTRLHASTQPAEPLPTLTDNDLKRMASLGTQLIALLSGDDLQRAWYPELVGATTLLEQAWTRLHNAWSYHRRKLHAAEPPTIYALGR